jgi:uracil phosphoribosyltransferase
VGEQFEELTLYCACIDAELDALGQVIPGFGDAAQRLYGNPAPLN